ncbi:DegT/DnrJ/EryC1/StrS family aminotransferase [Pandoraea nosoerga]|uniref:GDP-perosamine synthase n=1 Tax=Pandoraea nosoerga TaxID=2508296 RepID=A0A5E4UWX8_9BURK|nr:DegT/DnrJ/EryC1/StrS family aminotransferase [Pandoraea nosoerga]MBN4666574.1 DegT/DnrJ/EryC1/StrS family aminotransferase [Pandoraea nosoerga]MBN4674182.1 DegT/DnrJ/EryC1/StrS family aminotransferase [Pandoraea nosoerga]MBN4679884.1 DegT/DnrJ/EryC1/StrS family aminotransferase [Pandoraea nosoerga]MBN4744401.1 DegT/DnrJ/EryC1/StrS family aminotransferase [Pandoraea nosoerga]VVE03040.1 GDP-perosamine synthase [Pandoraea nosoerga]
MIPVYKPYLTGREKAYVNECLDSTWISSKGEFISRFEQGFAKFIGAGHVTTVSNGTVAIHLALEALGVGPGDEVIVPTLTYVASINTILQTGATPVYVDSLASTWQIDPDDVRRKITPRTKAVMVVHLYGLPCDMDAISTICRENKLLLVEDAAEAFGTLYKGQHVGTFGDVATFSFFGNKTITTGEGGMVVFREKAVAERAYHLKNQGVSPTREYWHDTLAYNYRMTNIAAAIGLAQLEQAEEIIAKKREIASWYREGLSNLPLKTHDEQPGTRHSFWMCSVSVDDPAQRQPVRDHLKAKGIETRPVFYPAHTLPHCSSEGHFPGAEQVSATGLNLPSWPGLTRDNVHFVCESLSAFWR